MLSLNCTNNAFKVSGCSQRGCFTEAMRRARVVRDAGARLGFAMDLVDIGGGFPGDDTAKATRLCYCLWLFRI